MPPKKDAPSKKTEQKKQAKVVEDKTFGLKNKNKSKAVQQYVKAVSNQVQNHGKGTMEKQMAEEFERKKQQKAEEEKKALLCSIFKSVETVKSMHKEDDGDTSAKICPYFKQGLCNKGKKCKMSHEMVKETHKIDIYTDQRNQLGDENEELDPEKLKELIKQKEGQYKKQSATELVCKYFLNALEKNTYGWKWNCPNGFDCHYRHCLPPGYVLKKDLKKEEDEEKLLIEDVIDEQREKFVRAEGTLVTLERFLEWKKKRAERKLAEEQKKKEEQQKKAKGGKRMIGLTGRALFVFDPTLFQDDADAADETTMQNREEVQPDNEDEEEEKKVEEQRKLLLDQENNHEDEEEEEEEAKEERKEEVEPQVEQPPQPVHDSKYIHIDEADMF